MAVAVAVAVAVADSCSPNLTPSLGISICHRCGHKEKGGRGLFQVTLVKRGLFCTSLF